MELPSTELTSTIVAVSEETALLWEPGVSVVARLKNAVVVTGPGPALKRLQREHSGTTIMHYY